MNPANYNNQNQWNCCIHHTWVWNVSYSLVPLILIIELHFVEIVWISTKTIWGESKKGPSLAGVEAVSIWISVLKIFNGYLAI